MSDEAEIMPVPGEPEVSSAIDMLANPEQFPTRVYFSKPKPKHPGPKATPAEIEAHQEAMLEYTGDVLHMQSKADFKAGSVVNEKINLVHVLAHRATVRNVNDETGEVKYVPVDRVVLMDDEGRTYEAVSMGLMQSILILFQLLGQPSSWSKPIPITIKSVDVRNTWRTFKIEIWKAKKGS